MKWIRAVFTNLWKVYVGVVFVLTALLLYPFFLGILSLSNGRKRSFSLFVFWSRLVSVLCCYPTKKNKKIEADNQPFILIANHTSYLDIFLMFAQFPDQPFLFLGKSEILSYPILRTYFKNLNIPVDRKNKMQAGQAFFRAKNALAEGFSLCIFPEGGIPDLKAPQMARFKDGAFILAQKTGCPIVCVAFTNNYKLFSDPEDIFGPARPGISKAFVHDPIFISADNLKEVKQKCYDQIESKLK